MNTSLPLIRFWVGALLSIILCAATVRTLPQSVTVPGGWAKVTGKRVLYFTKSAGYEHSVVKRSGGALSFSEGVLTELGHRHGFQVTCSKDGTIFTPEKLARYDLVVFYTSGDLLTTGTDGAPAMTSSGKATLLEAVAKGKGFAALHAANDSFRFQGGHTGDDELLVPHGALVDPYIAMLGAEFVRHGPQQLARVTVVDSHFPGCENLGERFEFLEEWYTFKDFTPDLHVILALETNNMKGIDYRRPPFPCTWARLHGKGRVFYTGLGHREDVWTNPAFQDLLLGGLGWAAGNVSAGVPPNLEAATPGYGTLQPKGEESK